MIILQYRELEWVCSQEYSHVYVNQEQHKINVVGVSRSESQT